MQLFTIKYFIKCIVKNLFLCYDYHAFNIDNHYFFYVKTNQRAVLLDVIVIFHILFCLLSSFFLIYIWIPVTMPKIVTAIVIGAGNRGNNYAAYTFAKRHPFKVCFVHK